MKKTYGFTLLLLFGFFIGLSQAHSVVASTTTETVAYQVNKADTTTPSLANAFFSHEATVTVKDGQATSVTLHITKNAFAIKSFSIGNQAAKITDQTTNTADLTFAVDDQFKATTLQATMSVMNMTQKADLVFAKALLAPDSEQVKFQVNKVGTSTPSLANSFFSPKATVTMADGRPATVTLHLIKNAFAIKSIAIGSQVAIITHPTADTADLTFNVDDQFKASTITAKMSVMNMTQQADLVFEHSLLPAVASKPAAIAQQQATQPVVKPVANPVATSKPTASTSTNAAKGSVSARLYQANNGKLTTTPSAAQQFIDPTAIVVRNATHTTMTLHTTGAEYIKAIRVAGQLGKITNQHGDSADLVFTLANAELNYAMPVTFSLSVPGAAQMTQNAFLLIDLAPQKAQLDPKAPKLRYPSMVNNAVPSGVNKNAHAINASLAQQNVSYTVLDASGNAISTANQYFTHTAHIVKDATGFMVLLTVRVPAGMVQFTPQSINGGKVLQLTHTTIGGEDVWTFGFHVADAAALDQLVPATIVMSVPMANIDNQSFQIELAFAKTANILGASAKGTPATKLQAKTPITIKKTAAAAQATHQTTNHSTQSVQSDQSLPQLKKYPIGWELLGFIVIDLLILLGAIWLRRRNRLEVAHD
ncbi:NEAT domain-containing protein [Lacticaseibacillus porcinae]|uniref:NEAT domain-containing protein n=1 Tax=Lacticaseibacillus porcinae TaxID=1123687 RepID=UPI000F7BA16A|nr:NEAT domain-containing protein [Lacticaseibacillus porcinae]